MELSIESGHANTSALCLRGKVLILGWSCPAELTAALSDTEAERLQRKARAPFRAFENEGGPIDKRIKSAHKHTALGG